MEILTARPRRLEAELIRRVGLHIRENERCMVLVPSQETLRTELLLMEGLSLPGSFLIDVLSPGRLRERIFERAGRPVRTPFDETGKRMVLCAALEAEQAGLRLYGRIGEEGRQAFSAHLSTVIACMKRAGLTPELLLELAGKKDGLPAVKLADIARIWVRYEALIGGKLADAEDVLQEVEERREASGVLRGCHVFVTGFDIITPSFAAELLGTAASAASLCLMVESDDNGAPDGALFAPVNASLDRLCLLASGRGVPVVRKCLKAPLGAPEDIAAAEAGLFALGEEPYRDAPAHIRLLAASNIRREVHLAAAAIRREMAAGRPAEDFAVAYPAGADYPALLSTVLRQYGITAYTAYKRTASAHPLSRFLLCALGAKEGDAWHMQEVTECIASGFLPLSPREADDLCAYCEQMEIRGSAFGRPFRYKAGNQMTDEALAALEDCRRKAAEPLSRLAAAMAEAGGADDVIAAVLDLLDGVNAYATLQRMREELAQRGMDSEAQDCAQLWNALMETLDQLHELLGGCTVSGRLVRRLLESGLSALELSALPPAQGAVICGEIGNLRTGSVHTLFVLGQNDREAEPSGGLFTPAEQAAVESEGVYLGMSERERSALARLDLLKLFAGVREELVVSYALASESGSALREGEAVHALCRLFPTLRPQGGLSAEELPELLCAPQPAALALALHLRDEADSDEPYAAVGPAIAKTEDGAQALRTLESQLYAPPVRMLDRQLTPGLYGKSRSAQSVTRLETFAECPYRYFTAYGLRPAREVTPGSSAADLGTLYHETAHRFVSLAMADPDFPRLPEDKLDSLLHQAQDELLVEWRNTPRGETRRAEAMERRIRRTAASVSRGILNQYAESGFVPFRTELVFGEGGLPPLTIRLSDGSFLYLKGRIDRVDVLKEDGVSLRIVDYKSSARQVDPTRIYYGLQLQLTLYMAAALAACPGMEAAGFFYFHIEDPTVRTGSRVKEEVEKKIAERFALSGVSLSDVRILRAMDAKHARMIKTDGSVRKDAAGLIDAEGMEKLLTFARTKAAELADAANTGLIDDSPYEMEGHPEQNACRYCDYAAICGFDPSRRPRRILQTHTLESFTGSGGEDENGTFNEL